MTTDLFLETLARYAGRYTWALHGDALRGRLPQGQAWEWECPLTVVAKAGTTRFRPFTNEARHAMRLIGLPAPDGARIQQAADYPNRYPRLRQQLFRICGLEPPA